MILRVEDDVLNVLLMIHIECLMICILLIYTDLSIENNLRGVCLSLYKNIFSSGKGNRFFHSYKSNLPA